MIAPLPSYRPLGDAPKAPRAGRRLCHHGIRTSSGDKGTRVEEEKMRNIPSWPTQAREGPRERAREPSPAID